MCGIIGTLGNTPELQKTLREMANAINHRGPNDEGFWIEENSNIHLGHKRLSIQDLSSTGSQPMHSKSGRFVIVYNGEIYNKTILKNTVESVNKNISWIGTSDTEILLESFEHLGIEETLLIAKGMFSIGLWDKKRKKLILVRDRAGEKPLFYGWQGETFVFASTLAAIKKFPNFKKEIDLDSLSLFMKYSYVPAPKSIYKNIKKLEAGSLLYVDINNKNTRSVKYWDCQENLISCIKKPFQGGDLSALNALEKKLSSSVISQTVSDVPIGCFLSGGIDSSIITSILQRNSNVNIKTFTIGFEDPTFNEANHALEVAKHLSTDHTEVYLSSKETRNIIPKLHEIYDEPFADSSQIPTFLVSKIAKEKVTVALSGDGGDELFAGYNRYFWSNSINNYPWILKKIASNFINLIGNRNSDRVGRLLNNFLTKDNKISLPGNKLVKLSEILSKKNIEDIYNYLISTSSNYSEIVLNHTQNVTNLVNKNKLFSNSKIDPTIAMMNGDFIYYLPDDIFQKVDRASMAVSLETRAPFMDVDVIDFAMSLPLDLKIRNGQGKWILKELLYRYVPKRIVDRPKMGFGVPIGDWLRGPLKDWSNNLLDQNRLQKEGYLNSKVVSNMWNEHLDGSRDRTNEIWNILMFQLWLENQ